MTYLGDIWYQAGWPEEIDEGRMLARTILGRPLLFFRDADGRPAAVLDRCPHRFAPLSAGKYADGVVTCGYHGLAFDGAGRCAHNPHGKATGAIRVESFAAAERHQVLWVWMGDAALADPDRIPDLSFIDQTPPTAVIKGLMPTNAEYRLLIDNIMDLSHADYLHPTTLGGTFTDAKMTVLHDGDSITVEYSSIDCEPAPALRVMVPPPLRADVRVDARWHPPGVMVIGVSAHPTGTPPNPAADNFTLHSMTPETASSTHYFYCSTRPFQTDDVELSRSLKAILEQAFAAEDKPMLEKQQQRIGDADFWSLKPLLLPVDSGAVQVRRKLEALIEAQQADPPHQAARQA
ncbi:aromatic ring-hydroxylating dioxygenase subunit alpha [Rhizorhabdus histidinilytica]|uniref:aromatic ring-hydroxylating dioxygenase subunit alpha n=1 Tax=Rhizorhabdus histidinilytica TaxID=439228 RepID=UPI00321FEB9E